MNLFQDEKNDSKLNFYSYISDNTRNIVPFYLNYNIPKKDGSGITKMRICAHKLNIETDGYTRPKAKREDRKCPHCENIETEMHFPLQCSKYEIYRL